MGDRNDQSPAVCVSILPPTPTVTANLTLGGLIYMEELEESNTYEILLEKKLKELHKHDLTARISVSFSDAVKIGVSGTIFIYMEPSTTIIWPSPAVGFAVLRRKRGLHAVHARRVGMAGSA